MSLTDSPIGIFSVWVNFHTMSGFPTFFILRTATEAENIDTIFYMQPPHFYFQVESDLGGYFGQISNSNATSLVTDVWYNILLSWDVSGGSGNFVGSLYISDILDTQIQINDFPITIPWSAYTNRRVLNSNKVFAGQLDGCVAHLYLNTDEYLDFTLVANRRKFITFDGLPEDLGANGELPTGTAPQFYFTGGADDFPTNLGLYGPVSLSGSFVACADGCPTVSGPWYFSQNFPSDSGGNPQIVYGFASTSVHDAGFSFFTVYELASIYGVTQARIDGITGDAFSDPFITQLLWGEIYNPNTGNDGGGAIHSFFSSVFWAVNVSSNDDIEIYAAPVSVVNPVSLPPVFAFDETITGAQRLFISSENWGVEGSNLYMGSSPASGDSPQIWVRDFGAIGAGGQWSNVKTFDSTRREVTCLLGLNNSRMYAAVSGTAGNNAELWDTIDGMTWNLVKVFTGRTFISSLCIFQINSINYMYALVYEPGVAREVYVSAPDSPDVYTIFSVDFTFPVGSAGSRLSVLAKRDSYAPDNTSMLFAGLGNDGGVDLDAKVYAFDGNSWALSADFNETFSDLTPSVTAMLFGAQGYAATGDYTLESNGLNIYTYRYESLP